MTTVGSATLELRGDISDFIRKMDQAGRKFESTTDHFRRVGERIQGIGRSLTTFVSLPIAGAGTAAVIAATKMDSLRRGLETVTGSAQAAQIQFTRLREIAKLPGLGLAEAIEGATRLQAAGLSAQEAEGALREFGNALATVGAGKAELEGVVRALTQIASKTVVSAEEINQLAERLPQIRRAMIAAFGTASTEEIQKMGISTKDFIAKVTAEFAKLERVSAGPRVAFENLTDSLFIMADAFGRILLPVLVPVVEALARGAEVVANFNPAVRTAIVVVGGLAAAIGPLALVTGLIIKNLPIIAVGLRALTGPVGLVITGVGLLTAAWLKFGGEVPTVVRATVNVLIDRFRGLMNFMGQVFDATVAAARTAWTEVLKPIVQFVKDATLWLVDKFGGVIGKVAEFMGRMVSAINPALGAALRNVQTFVEDVRAEMGRLEGAAGHADSAIIAFNRTFTEGFIPGMNAAANATGGLATELAEVEKRVRAITGFTERGPLLGDPFIVGERPSGPLSARPGTGNFHFRGGPDDAGNIQGVSPLSTPQPITAAAGGTGFLDKIKGGFGKLGEIVSGLLPSLSLASVGFALLAPIVKGIAEVLRPAIEALLEPLVEVGRVIGNIIKPILDALKEPLRLLSQLLILLLEPIRLFVDLLFAFELPLKVLSGVLRVVTIAFSYLYEGMGLFVEGLGKAIDKLIPDIISEAGKGLARTGQEMQDRAIAIRKGTREETDAIDETTGKLGELGKSAAQAANALLNVPQGFRILNIELARFNASPRLSAQQVGTRLGTPLGSPEPPSITGGGAGNIQNVFHITQLPGESGQEFANRVVKIMITEAVHKNLTDGKTPSDPWSPR